jgi:TPR repeat protein
MWYKKAAERGYADAQFNFGVCYYAGHGVEKDHTQAEIWFKKAAEQGLSEAKQALEILKREQA